MSSNPSDPRRTLNAPLIPTWRMRRLWEPNVLSSGRIEYADAGSRWELVDLTPEEHRLEMQRQKQQELEDQNQQDQDQGQGPQEEQDQHGQDEEQGTPAWGAATPGLASTPGLARTPTTPRVVRTPGVARTPTTPRVARTPGVATTPGMPRTPGVATTPGVMSGSYSDERRGGMWDDEDVRNDGDGYEYPTTRSDYVDPPYTPTPVSGFDDTDTAAQQPQNDDSGTEQIVSSVAALGATDENPQTPAGAGAAAGMAVNSEGEGAEAGARGGRGRPRGGRGGTRRARGGRGGRGGDIAPPVSPRRSSRQKIKPKRMIEEGG